MHSSLKNRFLPLFVLAYGLLSAPFLASGPLNNAAQAEPLAPGDSVRARARSERDILAPYWEGFIARAQGNCQAAVASLETIAQNGRGFEDAQAVFGICTMINAGYRGQQTENTSQLKANPHFITGRNWVLKAAQAGQAEAQAEMILLYLIHAGPNSDPAEGAKWAHLYQTNPLRLSLGIENKFEARIESLKSQISQAHWLEGKERARVWFPVFDDISSSTSAAQSPKNKKGDPEHQHSKRQKGKHYD